MSTLFTVQLIASFIVGGGVIAVLSLVAEKMPKRIAGIVLTFPTTVAMGFFFMGLTLSPEAVTEVIPSTLIPLGLSMLFAAVYAHVAEYSEKIIRHRSGQIVASYLVSIGLWFALAIPVVIMKLNNLAIGIAGYILIVLIAHWLLQRKNYEKPVTLTYTFGQKIGRAILVGFIIFMSVLLGKTLGPFWGGMFTMFPAVFTSLMIIIHWYYGSKSLFPTMQKVAIGSLSLFAYTITVMFVFPVYGFIAGTVIAYLVSLVVTLLLMRFQRETKSRILLRKA
jgi:hypothetical protein